MTDIISMLKNAQNENNSRQQTTDSVASFFNSMKPCTKTLPIQIKQQNTLENIERIFIPNNQDTQNNNASQNDLHSNNSPLAMFLNSNNFNGMRTVQDNHSGAVLASTKVPQNASTPPVQFSTILQSQPVKNNAVPAPPKETTKLITPNMLINNTSSSSNNNNNVGDKKHEPLTKNQMMQALKYLIENDEDFSKKVHEAYLKSLKN